MILDVLKASKDFEQLVGSTVADELLKRVENTELKNLNAERILKKVDGLVKNYGKIAKEAGKLIDKRGIVYLLSTKPHTSSNSNFVKLVKNNVVNNQTLKRYLINPVSGDQEATINIENTRNRLMRYLKLTKNEKDDVGAAAAEPREDLKKAFTRSKNENVGEKMHSYRRVNRLKVIVTALMINLIDWAFDEAKKAEDERKKKAAEEEARRKAEEAAKSTPNDPGIFRNLPNGGNYCYLNTALQNLYYNKSFSDKVLDVKDIPDDGKYKELRATQFFFKYLRNVINEEEFMVQRVAKAKDLGHGVGAGSSQRNSVYTQLIIERNCRKQMRELKNKSFRDFPHSGDTEKNPEVESSDDKILEALEQLYGNKELRERVLAVDEDQLSEEDKSAMTEFGVIRSFFKNHAEPQYPKNVLAQQLKDVRSRTDRKDFEVDYAKKRIENRLNILERQKRAYLLNQDAKMVISEPVENVLSSLSFSLAQGECRYLPLKNRQFVIEFNDRGDGSDSTRNSFMVESELELSSLINSGRLKVFIKNEKLDASKCKFKLVSATIATGGHYYLYRHSGSNWMRFNDMEWKDGKHAKQAVKCDWERVQDDASNMGELLTYELKN